MADNTFGERFRVTTFGESHGAAMGVVIDGCPAGHPFPRERIASQLARRRPGQGRLTSARREADLFEVQSGVDPHTDTTLGTPIAIVVRNQDAKGGDYDALHDVYRPSHADYTYDARYGQRFVEGGGRASARETVGRVAAGALAEDLLETLFGVSIVAWVEEVADIVSPLPDEASLTRDEVDAHAVRCPIASAASAMEACIEAARKAGDTVGGVLRVVARGVPRGLGAPVFDKLTATLAHAMMSLPAARGFEVGEGFASTRMRGSVHNDAFVPPSSAGGPSAPAQAAAAPAPASGAAFEAPSLRTRTNRSGGIQGGISNGEFVRFRVAFKPVATIFLPQDTVTRTGAPIVYTARGRHDPCVLPRAVPMVEAMTALVIFDQALRSLGVRARDFSR